jgi:hypothetical protein
MRIALARGRTEEELEGEIARLAREGLVPRGERFELFEYWSVEEADRGRRSIRYQAMTERRRDATA